MMRGIKQIFLVMIGLMAASPALAQVDRFEVGKNLVSGYIINGYEQLHREAELQSLQMAALCATPSAKALADARGQFAALVRAWSMIESVRFGPILKDNRLDRILFYPDRQGIGLRQVQAVLGTKDATALDLTTLRQKSVATQGLVALEFVLFGTGADAELVGNAGGVRCGYGQRVAEALMVTAQEVLSDWEASDGIGAHMAAPNPSYDDYRTEDEVLREIMDIFVHSVETLRDTRLLQLVGSEERPGSARTALYKRSELTLESAVAQIEGLRSALVLSGLVDLLSADQRWVAGSLDFEMQNFIRTADEIADMPIDKVIEDEDARSKLRYLLILTNSIRGIMVGQLANDLGLSAGFSSNDGD